MGVWKRALTLHLGILQFLLIKFFFNFFFQFLWNTQREIVKPKA